MPDAEGAPLMARTMDWMSFGVAGKFSLVISRVNPETGIRTAEVGIPGLVGTLTGVNNKGVSVAMNVTGYTGKITSIEGMPTTFYNRMVLENSSSFDEAEQHIATHKAMGPYHLTVADSTKCGTFSTYQGDDWKGNWSKDKHNDVWLRMMNKSEPLVTTNCSCTPEKHDMFAGQHRERVIEQYLYANREVQDVKAVLAHSQAIPLVNNQITTHRGLVGHNTLEVAFDNAYAGDRPLQPVNLPKVFA